MFPIDRTRRASHEPGYGLKRSFGPGLGRRIWPWGDDEARHACIVVFELRWKDQPVTYMATNNRQIGVAYRKWSSMGIIVRFMPFIHFFILLRETMPEGSFAVRGKQFLKVVAWRKRRQNCGRRNIRENIGMRNICVFFSAINLT